MLLQNNAYADDVRVVQEAESLAKAGYSVAVIAPRSRDRLAESAERGLHDTASSVRVYSYPPPRSGRGLLGYAWEYGYSATAMLLLSAAIFVRRGFDIVHAHNPPDILVAIAMVYRLLGRCRFVFDHHDLSPELYAARFGRPPAGWLQAALLMAERASCRRADLVIATNDSYRKVQIERCGVDPSRVVVVRNGPDVSRWPAPPTGDSPSSGEPLQILYVGRIGRADGVDYLVRALKILCLDRGRSDVRCTIVGSGDALLENQALCSRLGLDDRVRFTGWLSGERVRSHLTAAAVCVEPAPSNAYNDRSTTIKLMEYMAAAKPIVAFDLPEHRVTAGDAALYAKPNDETELASNIEMLIDDSARRAALGCNGRVRVEEDLAWSCQADKLRRAYAGL